MFNEFHALFSRTALMHPCTKNCSDRAPGCGASCKKWLDYVQARDEIYRQREVRCGVRCPTNAGIGRYNKKPKKK